MVAIVDNGKVVAEGASDELTSSVGTAAQQLRLSNAPDAAACELIRITRGGESLASPRAVVQPAIVYPKDSAPGLAGPSTVRWRLGRLLLFSFLPGHPPQVQGGVRPPRLQRRRLLS